MFKKGQSNYITPQRSLSSKRINKILAFSFCFLAMFSIVGVSMLSIVTSSNHSSVVHADSDSDFKAASGSAGGDEANFESTIKKAFLGAGSSDKPDFSYVLKRLFSTSYVNDVRSGVAAGGFSNPGYVCNTKSPGAGTVVYHNCDIPNITSEFLQGLISLALPTGVQGGKIQSAKVGLGFGLPSTIPQNTVPVNPDDRANVKYTALELFGYNLRYTSYLGEWDNIQVMTAARALSNFGLSDSLKLGLTSVINGVTNGFKSGIDGAINGFENGGPLGAIFGGISGTINGAAGAAIKTVLDTSDLNVVNLYSWYRAGIGGTLYNTRELNQVEIQQNLQTWLSKYISSTAPSQAKLPAEFQAISNPPAQPNEPISKCVIQKPSNGTTVTENYGDTSKAPGPSEVDCNARAKTEKGTATWTVDGTKKGQTLAQWRTANTAFFAAATKYGVSCTIDTTNDNGIADKLANFYSCWGPAWNNAQSTVLKGNQTQLAQTWFNNLLKNGAISSYLKAHPEYNSNAPWNRFVCMKSDGRFAINTDGSFGMAYSPNGTLNPGCMTVRPPIQNGFFGNGYLPGSKGAVNQTPGIDTRNTLVPKLTLFSIFLNPQQVGTNIANFGLTVSQFITKFANAILDLAFSPVLQKFGLDKMIITLISAFRDSLYFPLIALVIGFSAISVLFKAGRNKQYNQGLISLLLIFVTFFVSVIILFNPSLLIKTVDNGPAYVETAIVGTIFGVGNNTDNLCSATQSGGTTLQGINGENLAFSPKSSVRTMTCEVWKIWVFNPWVGGQWGTSYNNLYTNDSKTPNKLLNTNAALVGNAGVTLGGGVTVHNWALYQLQTMSSGTATTADNSKINGTVSKDIYRIVDAQAGPNNGAGTDGRYLNSWSGENPIPRVTISLVSIPSAIVGLGAVSIFAISKIILTFTSLIMLLFLPMMLLIGVNPSLGRTQLKGYVGTILSLMYQRIILVSMLAIMMRIITGFSDSGSSPLFSSIIAMVVSLAFILNRKKMLELAHVSTTKTMGQHFTSAFAKDPVKGLTTIMPRGVQQSLAQRQAEFKGQVGGAVGGFIVGGVQGAKTGSRRQGDMTRSRAFRSQRREGLAAFSRFNNDAEAARSELKQRVTSGENQAPYARVKADVTSSANRLRAERDTDNNSGSEGNGTPGVKHFDLDFKNPSETRDTARMIELEKKISALKNKKEPTPTRLDPTNSSRNNLRDIQRSGNERAGLRENDREEIKALEEEYDSVRVRLAGRYESREQQKTPLSDSLNDMRESLRILASAVARNETTRRNSTVVIPEEEYRDSNPEDDRE